MNDITHRFDQSARHCRALHPLHCHLGDLVGAGDCGVGSDVGLLVRLLGDWTTGNRKPFSSSQLINAS